MRSRKRGSHGHLDADLGLNSKEVAVATVTLAMRMGATAAEAVVRVGDEFTTLVRLGQVETLKHTSSKAIGVRVFSGVRSASTYASDLSEGSIRRTVQDALELSRITSADPLAALPETTDLGSISGNLSLYYSDVYSLPVRERINYARRAEQSALSFHRQIKKSEGATFDAAISYKALANSLGFAGEYTRSYCSVAVVPVAESDDGSMQRDYWYSVSRNLADLASPERVGQIAAQRALQRLGARKVRTSQVPVVFDQQVAISILEDIFECVNGNSVHTGASFLSGRLGSRVASSIVDIIDDGTIPGGFGTSPFDGEGVRTQKTVVIERGVLKSFLLNTYSARRLGLQTTGNASRGLAGIPGIGPNNFFLRRGQKAPIEIISDIKEGLYVTELLGQKINSVTGDYSRGAVGMWIAAGKLAFPVDGITITGNFSQMLLNISEIGSDLEFRGSVASPTIRIDGLTVHGRS